MRPNRALLVIIALGFGVAGAQAQTPLLLTCGGPFAKDASAATLIAAFGAENVRKAEIDVAEGATEPGTVIFPDDPKRRLEILWHDADRQSRPTMIRAGEGSMWRIPTPAGEVRVGTPLADAEKLNGRPFTVSGFEWDYGGYAGDWKGGALDRLPGGCSLGLRFSPDPKASNKALRKVVGDAKFSSSAPAMRAVKPSVAQMTIGWAE